MPRRRQARWSAPLGLLVWLVALGGVAPARAAAQPSPGRRWTFAATTSAGDSEFVNLADVRALGGRVFRVWALERPAAPKLYRGRSYVEALAVEEYDCAQRRMRTLRIVMRDSVGVPIPDDEPDAQGQWRDVVPESVGEAKLETICAATTARRRGR